MTNKKAVFLDRDGTIIKYAEYLCDPADVVLLPQAAEALSMLRSAGFLLFLFTNQSGVGRGWFTLDTVHRCNERMITLLDLPAPLFAGICIAPERPDEPSVYRKPNPRFINECVAKYGLDRASCWMVGDKPGDVETGVNAGINSALISHEEAITPAAGIRRYASLFDFSRKVTIDTT